MVPKAIALIWRATPRLAAANLFLTVLQGALPAVALYFSKVIVDGVVTAVQVHNRTETTHVLFMVSLWFGVQLFSSLIQTVNQFINSQQNDLISNFVTLRLMEKANTLDLSFFENAQFYDKLENARREASYRPAQMVTQLSGLLRSTVTLVAVMGVLASLSWWLVLMVVAISVPSLIYQAKYSGHFFALLSGRAPDQRRLNYLGHLLTTDTPVKELRIFGLHQTLLERYREIFERFYRENRSLNLKRTTSQFALGAIGTVFAGLTYAYVVVQTVAGRLTIGELTLYYQAFQQSQSQLGAILFSIGSTYESALFLSNLFDFLAFAPELPVPAHPRPLPKRIERGIVLENVSFQYPGTTVKVLNDVSFAIGPGDTIALVGANGAGKTTLVKLLSRLYDPTTGRITIDGIDLRDFAPEELRSRIGVIFQDYVRYQFTAGENIGFGRVEALADEERIARSAADAGADAVIATLPQGYATPLGRWFQDGHELSIGQWQKVAIARAFMRDADLLILDEPTSSLDVRSEFEVFRAFRELTRGKMAVIISHRFGTVRMADRIIVVEEGRVIENGSHDQLVARGGRYAELFDMQAASYR
jgi:ATP-binding cassette subfamily B protein